MTDNCSFGWLAVQVGTAKADGEMRSRCFGDQITAYSGT